MTSSALYLSILFVLSVLFAYKWGEKNKGFRNHLLLFSLSIIMLVVNQFVDLIVLFYIGIGMWVLSFLPLFLIKRKMPRELILEREKEFVKEKVEKRDEKTK